MYCLRNFKSKVNWFLSLYRILPGLCLFWYEQTVWRPKASFSKEMWIVKQTIQQTSRKTLQRKTKNKHTKKNWRRLHLPHDQRRNQVLWPRESQNIETIPKTPTFSHFSNKSSLMWRNICRLTICNIVCVCVFVAQCVQLFATPQTVTPTQPRDQTQASCIGRWVLYH